MSCVIFSSILKFPGLLSQRATIPPSKQSVSNNFIKTKTEGFILFATNLVVTHSRSYWRFS